MYGVVIAADGTVDEPATTRRRLEIREERLHGEAPAREAERLPASRRLTLTASSRYCGSRSFRSASTGVAMQIDE